MALKIGIFWGTPLLVAELVLRFGLAFGDPGPGVLGLSPEGLPGWPERRSVQFGGDQEDDPLTTYNRFGFRGPEWSLERVEGKKRVVLVGDSFGFGYGLPDAETLPVHLEARLPETEVLNLSIPGMNTHQEAMIVERWLPRLEPDLLLLMVILNDSEIVACNPPVVPDCLPPETFGESLDAFFLDHVYLYRGLSFLLSPSRCRGPQACEATLEPGTLQRRCLVASLGRVARVAREQEVRLLALVYPQLSDDWTPHRASEMGLDFTEQMKPLLEAEGIEYLELLPAFDEVGGASLKIARPDDNHPGPAANALTARLLAEHLAAP